MWQLLSWFTYLRIQLLRSGHPDHKPRSCIYSITFHNENFKRIYSNNTVEKKFISFVFRTHEQLFSFPSKLDFVFSRTWFALYNSRILKAHWTVDHRESLIMLYLKSELTFFIFFVQKYSNCGHMILLWLEPLSASQSVGQHLYVILKISYDHLFVLHVMLPFLGILSAILCGHSSISFLGDYHGKLSIKVMWSGAIICWWMLNQRLFVHKLSYSL